MKIKILVLPLLILAILVNMIPMSSGASAAEITYEMYVEIARQMVINAFNEKCADSDEYTEYIFIYDVDDNLGCVGTFVFMRSDVNITNIQIFDDSTWGEQIKITTDGLKSVYVNFNVKQNLENDIKLDVNIVDQNYIQESKSRQHHVMTQGIYKKVQNFDYGLNLGDENVVGGLPLQESELDVSWYQSFTSDITNHVFTFENVSDRDIYFSLMLYNSSKEKVYQYFHKQLFGGSYNSLIYYMNLQSLDDDQKIVWLSKFFSDSKFFGLEHSNEDCPRSTYEEIHSFLSMDDMKFLIQEHDIIVNGNLFPVYKAVFDTTDRDYSMLNFDWNKDKTIDYVNRNGVSEQAAYEVELRFTDQDYYEYDPIVHISPGESIRILVPESDLQIYPGDYQWVIGYNIDDSFNMEIHSTIAFRQEAATVYDPSDDQINGSGGFIVDGNGDKVGAHDFNGSFVLENEFEQTITDMSELDASNIKKLWESSSGYLSFFGDTLGIIPGWEWALVSSIMGLFIAVFVIALILGKR